MSDNRRHDDRSGLDRLSVAVADHNKLSLQIIRQVVPLLAKDNVSTQIKIYIGSIIFLVVSLSAGLVILVANVIVRISGINDIHFEYYLLYVCFVLGALLLVLVLTSAPARRLENTANLEFNMQKVARARASRKRQIFPRAT
jgi:TRAP-type C4-dicarboxylate transport system permease small subunit